MHFLFHVWHILAVNYQMAVHDEPVCDYGTISGPSLTVSRCKRWPCSLCDWLCLPWLALSVVALLVIPTVFHFLPVIHPVPVRAYNSLPACKHVHNCRSVYMCHFMYKFGSSVAQAYCVNFFLSCKKFNDTGCEAFSWSSSSSTTGTCVPYIDGVCTEKFHTLQQCLHVDSTGTIWVNKNSDNLNGLEHNLTYFITEIKSE